MVCKDDHYSPRFPIWMSLCNVTLKLFPSRRKVYLPSPWAELGTKKRWKKWHRATSEILPQEPLKLPLMMLPWAHYVKKLPLAKWRMRGHMAENQRTAVNSQHQLLRGHLDHLNPVKHETTAVIRANPGEPSPNCWPIGYEPIVLCLKNNNLVVACYSVRNE